MSTSIRKVDDTGTYKKYRIVRKDTPELVIEVAVHAVGGGQLTHDSDPIVLAGLQGFTGLEIEQILEDTDELPAGLLH